MHIGNGCPDSGLTLGIPRRFIHGDVIIYIHRADVLGTDVPFQVHAADVIALLGAPARALHPLRGALQATGLPWMENSDHLTGKKISMATESGRNITLPGRGGLDPLIRSYGMFEKQIFIPISTATPNQMTNQRDFFNPSPILITTETTPRSRLLRGSALCCKNVYCIWVYPYSENTCTLPKISSLLKILWPIDQYRHIDLFRRTFQRWASNICFTFVIHLAEVMGTNEQGAVLLRFCEEKATSKIPMFFPQAVQLVHYSTKVTIWVT